MAVIRTRDCLFFQTIGKSPAAAMSMYSWKLLYTTPKVLLWWGVGNCSGPDYTCDWPFHAWLLALPIGGRCTLWDCWDCKQTNQSTSRTIEQRFSEVTTHFESFSWSERDQVEVLTHLLEETSKLCPKDLEKETRTASRNVLRLLNRRRASLQLKHTYHDRFM